MTNKAKGKGGKIMLIALLLLLALLTLAACIYIYNCTHFWQADYKRTTAAGFIERQATLPDGSVINYAQGPDNGPALLLIHGQTGAWQDYSRVLPQLSQEYQVFAVDCYGHGNSSHDASKYYLKENGDDLIWFVDEIIKRETIVSGHSSGGLLAAYVAAYGGEHIAGAVLEDPPVYSTQSDYFEKSFAYHDTYKNMHEYALGSKSECWEAYYLRNCLWGQMYMASSMNGLANYAQQYHEKNPDKPVSLFFMPESINALFLYTRSYDFAFGEHFYDYTWHSGIDHDDLMVDIRVKTVFLHINEMYSNDGILMAASSNAQAQRAVGQISACRLVELSGDHNIHRYQPDAFIVAFDLLKED